MFSNNNYNMETLIENRFEELLDKAMRLKCTDIHFDENENHVSIAMRTINGLIKVPPSANDSQLLHYLQFHSHLDLANAQPQSGSFAYFYNNEIRQFRLATIHYGRGCNCVLRILNHPDRKIEELTCDEEMQGKLKNCLNDKSGLVLFSGLTGCGKTTTLYSLLSLQKNKIIYSLEDPIEAIVNNMIQLQINEKVGFGYDEGIRQILRHNPDLLMIGEIRDEQSAKMAVRAALSGTLVVSSIHAGDSVQALYRLIQLGVGKDDLKQIAGAVFNQRLCKRHGLNDYTCIYEVLDKAQINKALDGKEVESQLQANLRNAVLKGWIDE